MKNAMFQIDFEETNSFGKFSNQTLTSSEMSHLIGGDGGSGGTVNNDLDPPIYIKED